MAGFKLQTNKISVVWTEKEHHLDAAGWASPKMLLTDSLGEAIAKYNECVDDPEITKANITIDTGSSHGETRFILANYDWKAAATEWLCMFPRMWRCHEMNTGGQVMKFVDEKKPKRQYTTQGNDEEKFGDSGEA